MLLSVSVRMSLLTPLLTIRGIVFLCYIDCMLLSIECVHALSAAYLLLRPVFPSYAVLAPRPVLSVTVCLSLSIRSNEDVPADMLRLLVCCAHGIYRTARMVQQCVHTHACTDVCTHERHPRFQLTLTNDPLPRS